MPRPRKVMTPDNIAAFREAYGAMRNYAHVGKLFGVSPNAVRAAVVDGGNWRTAPIRLSLDQKDAILDQVRAGEPIKEIARNLHVSQSTVSYYTRAAGLQRANGRPPSRRGGPLAPEKALRRRCPVEGCYDITTNPRCRHGHVVYEEPVE